MVVLCYFHSSLFRATVADVCFVLLLLTFALCYFHSCLISATVTDDASCLVFLH